MPKVGSPCHRCPHGVTDSSGAIKPAYQGVEYAKMPCAGCTLDHSHRVKYDNDSYNGGTTLISLSGKAEEYISSKALDSHTDDPLQAIYEMPQERMVEAIRSMLHTLSRMSSRRQNIFLHRLAGMSYPEICREVGISLRAVHRHYHIALEKIMETTRKD